MGFEKKDNKDILHIKEYDIGTKLPLLYFPLLEQTGIVEHCFTTRMGGVSRGIFESLNLSFTRGDAPEAVMENYRRVAQAMGREFRYCDLGPDPYHECAKSGTHRLWLWCNKTKRIYGCRWFDYG